MTIKKGEAWGEPGALPPDGVLARTDREVRAVVEASLAGGTRPPAVGLLGGDLCRTVGGRGDEARLRSDAAVRLPVDLGHVWLDDRQAWFASHLVARRSWWRGRLLAVVNAQYLGSWDLAPTGHPNDGRLDVVGVSASMSVRERFKARRRLPLGTHVPHPAISTRRVTSLDEHFDPPLEVWLDGVPEGAVHHLRVECLPDALTVVV